MIRSAFASLSRSTALSVLALALILALAGWLRLSNVDWDEGQHLHPDERFLTMVGTAIQPPATLAQYFDTQSSPLNPYNRGYGSFVYGTYPLFLVRGLAEPLQAQGYDRLHLLGRTVSAAHDLGSVALVFLIGSHLYRRRVGLLGALLYGLAVLPIQHAHFFTVDSFLTFYIAAAFYCLLRALDQRSGLWYALAGAALGLAMASKVSAVLFLALPAAAVALDWLRHGRRQQRGEPHSSIPAPLEGDHSSISSPLEGEGQGGGLRARGAEDRGDGAPRAWSPLTGALLLGLVAAAVFRVAQPYAFAGPSILNFAPNAEWLSDLSALQRITSGEVDFPPSHQWTGRIAYLFPLHNLLFWGLGLPLGLAVLGGVALAAAQLVRGWPASQRQHLLILLWTVGNFVYWGGQFVKTMRYLLPIYPMLAVLAALALVWLLQRARETHALRLSFAPSLGLALGPSLLRPFAALALVAVVAGTAFYALAFASIYDRPVTRVAASDWIYEHLPPGTAFAWEHWDDPLPLRRPGRDPSVYASVQLELYHDDTPEKRESLLAALDQVDYVFLSSNRLYESIPRLPMRYPLTTEYYRLLFNGELGFALEQTFTSYPTLLGVSLSDDRAEEAFSVYDHPRVLIFRKTADYSPERSRQLLEAADLDTVIRLRPILADRGTLLLDDADRAIQEQGGTWTQIFDRDGLANRFPAVAWLLAVQVLALAVFPLAWRVLSGLPDRGYLLAKLLGLLAVSYLAWLFASLRLLEYGLGSIALALFLVAAGSAWLLTRHRAEILAFLRARWRLLALEEALFLGAFAAFVAIRMANPDLWHPVFGGEKPMDFAYLNAVVKSTFFPPYDPWFAGGYINYYYFGFVLVATVIKVAGVVPWVAYNLAIPLLFALTVGAAFTFGHALLAGARAHRWWTRRAVGAGLLAATLVAVVGNLDPLVQMGEALGRMGGVGFESRIIGLAGVVNGLFGLRALLAGQSLPALDFWRSTRVIRPEDPGPITEFPYFSFLYADLHAHVIALPITLAVIVVALNALRQAVPSSPVPLASPSPRPPVPLSPARPLALSLLLTAWLVGALRPTNTWDYPTYLALAAVAFGLAVWRVRGRLDLPAVLWTGVAAGALVLFSHILFYPYLRHYVLFYTGFNPVSHTTSFVHYATILGGFLLLFGGLVAVETWRLWRRAADALADRMAVSVHQYHAGLPVAGWLDRLAPSGMAALALLAIAVVFYLQQRETAALVCAALALVAFHALRPARPLELRYLLAMVGLALILTLVPELVALQGDIGRMNTVFKLHFQAWTLLALASAVAVFYVDRWLRGLGRPERGALTAWRALVVVVMAALLLYPLLATNVRLGLRFHDTPPTLDGMAYMRDAVYDDDGRSIRLGADYEAINWMLDNVEGSPTIVETVTPLYRWGSRVSVYTGLPTVLGWDWHQKQQRGDFAWMIDDRAQDVRAFYETASPDEARRFLDRYRVGYVYVGPVERTYHRPEGLAKFDAMPDLTPVFRSEEVTIYQVQSPRTGLDP